MMEFEKGLLMCLDCRDDVGSSVLLCLLLVCLSNVMNGEENVDLRHAYNIFAVM